MRIDASNLILAAQAQTQRPAAAKGAEPRFEPLDFAKSPTGQQGTRTSQPGAVLRPGAQLDIKV
jgi:hypothetical protein